MLVIFIFCSHAVLTLNKSHERGWGYVELRYTCNLICRRRVLPCITCHDSSWITNPIRFLTMGDSGLYASHSASVMFYRVSRDVVEETILSRVAAKMAASHLPL